MKYTRSEAKAFAKANLKGIWAAALTPFAEDLQIDEGGLAHNIGHWAEDLGIAGLFIGGKQGEFFSLSVDERKRLIEVAVEAADGKIETMMSCSDQNLDVVLELARHSQEVGADYIVVHAPMLHFFETHDETLLKYYETITKEVDIGLALWSHPDSGYVMSPELCNRLADLETVVAIKYSVPRAMYAELTAIASDRLQVSAASEAEWLDNIIELGWQLYLCSSPPFLLQTATDRRMHEYTQAAFAGHIAEARNISESLEAVREALKSTRPPEKPHAHQKYWQSLLGQVGGRVRPPMLELTEAERKATFEALVGSGLDVPARG